MTDLTDELKHKAGPLPIWAWGVLAVGGVFAFQAFKGKTSSPSTIQGSVIPVSQTPPSTSSTTSVPTTTASGSSQNAANTAPIISSNAQWQQLAVQWATNNGYIGTDAITAFQNALSGSYLSPVQLGMVNGAISYLGPPPDGMPPIDTTSPTVPNSTIPQSSSSLTYIHTPAQLSSLYKAGYTVTSKPTGPGHSAEYYNPNQPTATPSTAGLTYIHTPAQLQQLEAQGFTITPKQSKYGTQLFYNPKQFG